MNTISTPMGLPRAIKSEPIYGVRILRDVKVPMRDGVKLSVNIFLPETEGRFPVIFERMPYGGSGRDPGEFYAQRGYALVIQDCRGRHDSEGEFYPFRDDTPDGLDSAPAPGTMLCRNKQLRVFARYSPCGLWRRTRQ